MTQCDQRVQWKRGKSEGHVRRYYFCQAKRYAATSRRVFAQRADARRVSPAVRLSIQALRVETHRRKQACWASC